MTRLEQLQALHEQGRGVWNEAEGPLLDDSLGDLLAVAAAAREWARYNPQPATSANPTADALRAALAPLLQEIDRA